MANGRRTGELRLDARDTSAGPSAIAPAAEVAPVVPADWFAEGGAPYPVGARYLAEAEAYNFTLYSRSATRVELLLYGDDLVSPLVRLPLDVLKNRSGRVWHARTPVSA